MERKKIIGSKNYGCPSTLMSQNISLHIEYWTLKVACGVHNYLVAKYIEDHSYLENYRRVGPFVLVDMSKCQVRHRAILILFNQTDPKNTYNIKMIHMHRHRLHK